MTVIMVPGVKFTLLIAVQFISYSVVLRTHEGDDPTLPSETPKAFWSIETCEGYTIIIYPFSGKVLAIFIVKVYAVTAKGTYDC